MKTFHQYLESFQQDFAREIAPELTKTSAEVIGPMLSIVVKMIESDPSFITRFYTLLKSEALHNPDYRDAVDSLDIPRIKNMVKRVVGKDSQEEISAPKGDSPLGMYM